MLKKKRKQMSLHSPLYDQIPENHFLKKLNAILDFSFINEYLEASYCKDFGRPAKEPEMMVRLLILQHLYKLTDEDLIEEANFNLLFKYFIGLNPEEKAPCSSLLSIFRNERLLETTIDDIIEEVVRQAVRNGIINALGASIDTTHLEANTNKLIPERLMKHIAKRTFKNLNEELGSIPEEINTDIPEYKEIESHTEAKEVMKDYVVDIIQTVKENTELDSLPKTKKTIEQAETILADPKFLKQKGVRSIVDEDARVGRKDKDTSFFGYKVETMMTEDGIITAVNVQNGAYVDGTNFEELLNRTLASGVKVEEVYGDRAYFRADILKLLKKEGIDPIIPVSASAYRINEELFSYNKDSDQWMCVEGNETIKKKYYNYKGGRKGYKYYFDKKYCPTCPRRSECMKKARGKAKVLNVSINANDLYEFSQRTKMPDFDEKFKKRAPHEGKNGEMKNKHGLGRARGYGLKSITIQAKLTGLVVTLKRIVKLACNTSFYAFVSLQKCEQIRIMYA